jgi:TolB-like protein
VAVAYLSVRLYSQTGDETVFLRGKSVAVLPFKNIAAGDQANSVYFSDGVAEEILSGLADVEGLRVAARTSSFVYRDDVDVREVGELLNVSTVLEGSIRLDPDYAQAYAGLADASFCFFRSTTTICALSCVAGGVTRT